MTDNNTSKYKLALENGFTDEDIIQHRLQQNPALKEKIKKAYENNFTTSEIAEHLANSYDPKSSLKARYQEASGNKDVTALERQKGKQAIYQEAETEARKNLGFTEENITPKERQKLRKEVDRLLGREGEVSGGGIIPQTSAELSDIREKGRYAARGMASGTTFGLTKHLEPNEVPEEFQTAYMAGELAAETLPLTYLFKLFRLPGKLASNASVAQRILNPVLNVLKGTGAGATVSTIKQAFQGEVPNLDEIIKNGMVWGALEGALNIGGGVGKGIATLFRKNIQQGKSANTLVENLSHELNRKGIRATDVDKVGREATELLGKEAAQERPNTVNNLKNRKVQPEIFEERELNIPEEPSVPEIPEVEKAPTNVSEARLDDFEPRAQDSTELGAEAKESVNEGVEAITQEFNTAYELFNEETIGIHANMNDIVRDIWERAERVHGGARAQPRGQEALTREFYQVMEDLGAIFERDENGHIVGLAGSNPVPLSNVVRAGKTTGKLGSWGVGNNVRKNMNAINDSLKQRIRREASAVPGAEEVFNEAEELYKTYIDLYENPTISKFREKKAKPEDVKKFINNPTDMARIRDAVTPEVYRKIEREFLQKLNGMELSKATEYLREMQRHLSDDARRVADEIILAKTPNNQLTPRRRLEKTENWILSDFVSPGKPNKVISLWNTPAGQKEIRQALRNNPNRNQIIKYLQEEKFWKNSESFVKKDGAIDYNYLSKWFNKPENREMIREIAGDDGVKFFDYLIKNNQKIKTKGAILEKMENLKLGKFHAPEEAARGNEIIQKFAKRVEQEKYPYITKVEELWDNLSDENKAIIGLLSAFKLGVYKTLFALKGRKALFMLLKKPRLRQAVKDLFNGRSKNPYAIYALMDKLQKENPEDEEEEF